ncbi:MAG TPA: hypothetical protein VGI33_19750 [Paenibacillus sp.]
MERFPWAKDTIIFTDDSWYQILWDIFEELDRYPVKPKIFVINEKYGAVTIDYSCKKGCQSEVHVIVKKYVALSEKVCEVCGLFGSVLNRTEKPDSNIDLGAPSFGY